MAKCRNCSTDKCYNYGLIEQLKKEASALKKGNQNNKDYHRKIIKVLLIACGILVLELIFTLAFGKEGVLLVFDKIIEFIK